MFTYQDHRASLESRVQDLLDRLTGEEKIGFLPVIQAAVPRLGIGEYSAEAEGAHGVVDRKGGKATVFPQPQGLSCTWDRSLLREVGGVIGDEARGYYDLSNHTCFLSLFCPTIDMERDPRWGRNEEAYGEDPFLAGKLSAELIQGIQGDDPFYVKAVATPKHFYANNFERDRGFTDSVLTPRTKQEYYLRVFSYALREGKALSLMTAYNRVNGIPAMLNPELNSLIRAQWGWEGYFITDAGALWLTVAAHKYLPTLAETFAAALRAGMNVFLNPQDMVIQAAHESLEKKLVTEEDISGAISHTLRVRFRLGHFDADPSQNPYAGITRAVLCSEKNTALAKRAAREAVVLLKNDGILPLAREKNGKIAVIGTLGGENMPDWYSGNPPYETTPLAGIAGAFPKSQVVYVDGNDTCGLYNRQTDRWLRVLPDGSVSLDGTESDRAAFRVYDWGYGGFGFRHTQTQKYLTTTETGELRGDAPAMWGWYVRELFFCRGNHFLPEESQGAPETTGMATRRGDSIYNKPYAQGGIQRINELLAALEIVPLSDGLAEAAAAARDADAAVVVLGNHSLVGARECIDRETLDLPVRMTALLESAFRANPNTILCIIAGFPYAIKAQEKYARGILYTSHGAQEAGAALGAVLAGDYNPAGRLSMTWYLNDRDLPDLNDYDIIKNKCTYLYYDKPVLYPFGYGLSYTTFAYDKLRVSPGKGGVQVSFTVKNTGTRAGDETAQVYAASTRRDLPRPRRQLCGFERIHLQPGEERALSFEIPREDLAYYDEAAGVFAADTQDYCFMIGAGSEDIRASQTISLG
ncbi:MAG: glycoside hydrolase family 3 C-terminal domain-containing protein [Treponema sp.]|jgi:beta-glucosidase|nr:glycoside hydrolase family 3 C-terminal domain-containing protein [Treponema sp.]